MTLTQNYKFAKFGPKTKSFSNFYEISHSQQIEHAKTFQCLEHSRDYWLRMIIDSEWLKLEKVIKTWDYAAGSCQRRMQGDATAASAAPRNGSN